MQRERICCPLISHLSHLPHTCQEQLGNTGPCSSIRRVWEPGAARHVLHGSALRPPSALSLQSTVLLSGLALTAIHPNRHSETCSPGPSFTAIFPSRTGGNTSGRVQGLLLRGQLLPLAVDRQTLRVCFVSASCSLNHCSKGSTNRMRAAALRNRSGRFSLRSFLLTRRIAAMSRKDYAIWPETQTIQGTGRDITRLSSAKVHSITFTPLVDGRRRVSTYRLSAWCSVPSGTVNRR
jgi:hypothetical protein